MNFAKRALIALLAGLGAAQILAGLFGWAGVLPAFFVGLWIGYETRDWVFEPLGKERS